MNTIIYTDGSSIGNPGYGGWAAVILQNNEQIAIISDGYHNVTNNQMELMGAISGLQWCVKHHITSATIITDSQYVKNGIESRIINRKKNGRRTAARKPVLNQQLRKTLDSLTQTISVTRGRTKGHSTNKRNNLVDHQALSESQQKKNTPLPYADIGSEQTISLF